MIKISWDSGSMHPLSDRPFFFGTALFVFHDSLDCSPSPVDFFFFFYTHQSPLLSGHDPPGNRPDAPGLLM